MVSTRTGIAQIGRAAGLISRKGSESDYMDQILEFESPSPYMYLFRHDMLGRPECPFAERWTLNLGLFSFRVHHWIKSDDIRAEHDHPAWFLTLVVKGSYNDLSGGKIDYLRRGSIRFRKATHTHIVQVPEGGAWTFLIFGRKTREWGFFVRRANGTMQWVKANKYFLTHGHHPCDQP